VEIGWGCMWIYAHGAIEFSGIIDLDLSQSTQVRCKLRIHRISHHGYASQLESSDLSSDLAR